MKRPLPQRSPGLARHLAASLIAALTIAPGLGACVGDECANVMCGQCDDPGLWVQVQEVVSGPFLADATVTAGGTTCARFVERTDGMYRCDLPAGTYDITVTAPGHVSKTTSATLAEPSPGACCTCGGPYLLVEVKLDLAP